MKIGIVGFGKMGQLYDRLLNATYIVDPFPVQNKIYFSHIDDFLHYMPQADLVIITTPSFNHYELIKKLLNANYNLLVEKPIVLSFEQAKEIENIAKKKKLILYQSTLERYNPVITYIKKNLDKKTIKEVESYRIGFIPNKEYSLDAIFDLGIHDVDLSFFLFNRSVKWIAHVGYGEPLRQVHIFLKNGNKIICDLMNKTIYLNETLIDFSYQISNPIKEMFNELIFKGSTMNEKWSKEINILEQTESKTIIFVK